MTDKTSLPAETRTDPLTRFEVFAALYYRRFHRLAPGKDEPMASYRSSSDPENQRQYAAWITSGQALEDAIGRIAEQDDRIADLEGQL